MACKARTTRYIPKQVESCMQVATLDANGSMEIVELEL